MHIFLFSVERTPTQFGQVKVYWQLVRRWPNSSFSGLSPGQEFVTVTGFVRFSDGAPSQVITVTPSSDGIAELDEQFELRLINATGVKYITVLNSLLGAMYPCTKLFYGIERWRLAERNHCGLI